MPLALANVLQSPILIFKKDCCQPYSSSLGAGHYDAVLPCTTGKAMGRLTSCRCGVNAKTNTTSCHPNPLYATRCKCFASGRACTLQCYCKNCINLMGARPPTPQVIRRQKRTNIISEAPNSKKNAESRGETPSEAIWSNFESILIHQIRLQEKDIESIFKVYSDTVTHSRSSFSIVCLPENVVFRKKSIQQIKSKLATLQ